MQNRGRNQWLHYVVAMVLSTMVLLSQQSANAQSLYGLVVDGSGDPTTSNLYMFGTDGTSSSTNVAALTNVVVTKASTTDSASQLYWSAVASYPENGIISIDVTSGNVVDNVTLTSNAIVCLAVNPSGDGLAVVTKDGGQISLWTYYYNGTLVLEATSVFDSYFPSGDCAVYTTNFIMSALVASTDESGSTTFTTNIITYSFDDQQFISVPIQAPSNANANTWSIAGLVFDPSGTLYTMFNWNDNNCTLATLAPAGSGPQVTLIGAPNMCNQQAAGGLLLGSDGTFYTWLLEATNTVFPNAFVTIDGDTLQVTSVPSFPFNYPFFISAGLI